MKKLATKLTPAIKAWIKEEFKNESYESRFDLWIFHFPNYLSCSGFMNGGHVSSYLKKGYTEVSESEFLAEFAKPKIDNTERVIEVRDFNCEEWIPRVLVCFKNDTAICWINAKTIEDSKEIYETNKWIQWREIPETITKKEAEKLLAENGIHKTVI